MGRHGLHVLPPKEIESVEAAKEEIVQQLDAIESGTISESPMTLAVELQYLLQSEDPTKRSIGELLSGLGEIRTAVSQIQRDLTSLLTIQEWQRLVERTLRADSDINSSRVFRNYLAHQGSGTMSDLVQDLLQKVLSESSTKPDAGSANPSGAVGGSSTAPPTE